MVGVVGCLAVDGDQGKFQFLVVGDGVGVDCSKPRESFRDHGFFLSVVVVDDLDLPRVVLQFDVPLLEENVLLGDLLGARLVAELVVLSVEVKA